MIDATRFPRYARQRTENILGKADHRGNMEMQTNRFPYLPLLIVCMGVILSSNAGIAAITAWIPTPAEPVAGRAHPAAVPMDGRARARSRDRCAECGVIISIRDTDPLGEGIRPGAAHDSVTGNTAVTRLNSPQRYEMTIRLYDGSHLVIDDASPISGRPGGRVVVIDGVDPSKIRYSPRLVGEYAFGQ